MLEDRNLKHAILTLERLDQEPYVSIICYPKPSKAEIKKRLKELRKLGVTAIEFLGEKQVSNLPVLGKGYVGVVVVAYRDEEKMALKIRRVDANRAKMHQEAKLLGKANSVGVGPNMLRVSRNFLLMQFVDGVLLPKWLEKNRGKKRIRKVLREILDQCWRLDNIGLDHGELSHAPKHVIVDDDEKPFIVDFEAASMNRRPANVTSICQFLFLSSKIAKVLAAILGEKDRKAVINALKLYKKDSNHGNFCRVLEACML